MISNDNKLPKVLRQGRYVIFLLLPLLWACGGSNSGDGGGGFSLTGNFPSCQLDSVHIYKVDGFVPQVVMSAPIVQSGNQTTFNLSGNLPAQGFYLVGKAPNNLISIILGNEQGVTLSGNCSNLRQFGKVEGSKINEEFRAMNATFQAIQQQMNMSMQKQNMGLQANDAQLVQQSALEINGFYNQLVQFRDSLKQSNPFLAKVIAPNVFKPFDPTNNSQGYANAQEHLASEFLADIDMSDPAYNHISVIAENMRSYVQAVFGGALTHTEAEEKMDAMLARMPEGSMKKNVLASVISTMDQVRSTSFLKYSQQYLSTYQVGPQVQQYLASRKKMFEEEAISEKLLGIGAVPPEIDLPTPEGKNLKLSQLKGKVVLLDFWASWCKPCRAENPNVVRVYNKYKSKGFDILSISLDRSRDPWLKAIEKDQMTWNHVSDLKFWQSEAAQAYRVSSIPATFLLDKDGKIIAKNLRGPALEAKIAEVLGG